jgi:hypothetical protein
MFSLSDAFLIPILEESSAQQINPSPLILERFSAYPMA